MEIIGLIVVLFVIAGVVLAIRERHTGRGAIVDERPPDRPETELDRETIRIEAAIHQSGQNPPH